MVDMYHGRALIAEIITVVIFFYGAFAVAILYLLNDKNKDKRD